MDQAELTGLIAQRPQNFAWFIGAGASRTAGLPTATDIIWYMKRRYYRQEENQDVSEQDAQHDAVKAKIQAFMDSRGFPRPWSEGEYSAYFDRIFGDNKERQRRFLSAILSEDKVTLSVGNRVLAAMLAAGFTRLVFTTNFDTVVERAYAEVSRRSLAAFHLEGSYSAIRALNNEEFPLYCKMHGDFRHDSIKNLTADLATQNDELARCFQSSATRAGLIVAGFSGRDASVMELFNRALDQPNAFQNGLFWTEIRGLTPPPAVVALIAKAKSKGIESGLIPIETYDSLMLRIWRNLDNKPQDLDRMVNRTALTAVNIPVPQPGQTPPLLRLNALPITSLPRQCISLAFAEPKSWDDVRQARVRANGTVILTKTNSVLGWGTGDELKDAFGGTVHSLKTEELPVDIGAQGATVIKGFMEEALCKALSRGKPLVGRTNAKSAWLIAAPEADTDSSLAPLNPVVGLAVCVWLCSRRRQIWGSSAASSPRWSVVPSQRKPRTTIPNIPGSRHSSVSQSQPATPTASLNYRQRLMRMPHGGPSSTLRASCSIALHGYTPSAVASMWPSSTCPKAGPPAFEMRISTSTTT